MGFFKDLFTWWNGTTLSTKLYTRANGKLIGEDVRGNQYYEDPKRVGPAGRARRWVIYNGYADPSAVPPEWFGWLHYTVEQPPFDEGYHQKPWEKPPLPNLTGTPLAYRPPGSLLGAVRHPPSDVDYQPWQAE